MPQTIFLPEEIKALYAQFNAPIAALDCGKKCAPYNVGGIPFCCDICHAVPTAYNSEWAYLQPNTNLWDEWRAEKCTEDEVERQQEYEELRAETPDNMVLLECLGPAKCQRDYRTLTCRQFPFFPYIDSQGKFLGLSYYWEYEDSCWVISNLQVVTAEYVQQFTATFDKIFARMPDEMENYHYHSERMRDEYNKIHRAIPLLHRNGHAYKISTHNERMRRVPISKMPKFGPYKIAAALPFPDEVE